MLSAAAVAFVICASNVCDDEAVGMSSFYDLHFSRLSDLISPIALDSESFLSSLPNLSIPESTIFYLEMHEKSPPSFHSQFLAVNL